MKTTNGTKIAVILAAVAFSMTGCGGGGGGGESASAPATPTNSPPSQAVNCPNGSTAPTTGAANCPVVATNAPITLSSVTPRSFKQGLTVQFNGALDPNSVTNTSVVLWKGSVTTGTKVAGTASLSANSRDLTYAATQFLANGSSYTLDISVTDTIGRPVHLMVPFTTTAMVCADNAIWSNPANFSSIYQDCVADIGVQTLVKTFNTLQDETCVVTTGVPLSAACKAYMANGTMMLANTSVVANGHSTMWMAYIGTNGKSTLVLLDVNSMSNPMPLGVMSLSAPLIWLIGNPTGVNIDTNVSGISGVLTNTQVTWNASSSTLVATCMRNC